MLDKQKKSGVKKIVEFFFWMIFLRRRKKTTLRRRRIQKMSKNIKTNIVVTLCAETTTTTTTGPPGTTRVGKRRALQRWMVQKRVSSFLFPATRVLGIPSLCSRMYLFIIIYFFSLSLSLLGQHLLDDDVVELVSSLHAEQIHGHVFALVWRAVSFWVEDWVEEWTVDSD